MGGAHLQCVHNYYAKFEYKEMKTVADTDYKNHLNIFVRKMSSSTPQKIFIKCTIIMQSLNKKNENFWSYRLLLELQITQTRHPKSVAGR